MSEKERKSTFGSLFKSRPTVILAVGILAGLILIFIGRSKSDTVTVEPTPDVLELTNGYVSELEGRISALLEAMDGVYDVRVIITAEQTAESIYATDVKDGGDGESDTEYVMKDSNGEPILLGIKYPQIKGVAVVCRGGSDPVTRERMITLLSSLLGIGTSRIYVVS